MLSISICGMWDLLQSVLRDEILGIPFRKLIFFSRNQGVRVAGAQSCQAKGKKRVREQRRKHGGGM